MTDTQSRQLSPGAPGASSAPRWWTDQHTSAWDKVKQAFRRDWEQTKADLCSHQGRALNQDAADTVEQALGLKPTLPLQVKTRRTDPVEAARVEVQAARYAGEETAKANVVITGAQGEIHDAQAKLSRRVDEVQLDLTAQERKAEEKIARAQEHAFDGIHREQARMAEVAEAAASSDLLANGVIADEEGELRVKVQSVQYALAAKQRTAGDEIASARGDAAAAIGRQEEKMHEATAERDLAVAKWRAAEQRAHREYAANPRAAVRAEAKAARHAAEETAKANETCANAKADIGDQEARLGVKVGDIQGDLAGSERQADERTGRAQAAASAGIEKQRARMAEVAVAGTASRFEGNGVIAGEEARLGEKVQAARQELASRQRKASAKISAAREGSAAAIGKQQAKINAAVDVRDDAVARWREAEREARYGFGARTQYPIDHVWDEDLEEKLQREWSELHAGRAWDESKPGIRRGWDLAGKKG